MIVGLAGAFERKLLGKFYALGECLFCLQAGELYKSAIKLRSLNTKGSFTLNASTTTVVTI